MYTGIIRSDRDKVKILPKKRGRNNASYFYKLLYYILIHITSIKYNKNALLFIKSNLL